jgi:hypothetical protein
MTTDLSKLAGLIEEGSLPVWLREEIEHKREDILKALTHACSITLRGPRGERVTIAPTTNGTNVPA